jgi:hypothetical protein
MDIVGSEAKPPLALRRQHWHQTAKTRISGPDEAAELIGRLGLITLYPVSPEIPNLFQAFTGDPDSRTAPAWDSPSGQVYGWRWGLGRRDAGLYTAIVRGRPTWVSWALLPVILRLRGELRSSDELYDTGAISPDAHRILQALEDAKGVLGTGELRQAAGFPTGKAERAAYLKAVNELDTRLMVAKVFSLDDEDMRHALVRARYPEAMDVAENMGQEEAMDRFLLAYLPHALYAAPATLARDLQLPEVAIRAGLDRIVALGQAEPVALEGYKGRSYQWRER